MTGRDNANALRATFELTTNCTMCNPWRMSTLSDYLTAHRISQRAFAKEVDVDPSMISRLAGGTARPSLELAVSIERRTRGAVRAVSWIADPEAQEAAE